MSTHTHTLTDSQLCSIGYNTIHIISDNTRKVPLICLHHIHHSQSGSVRTTVLGTISQILSIPLPLVGEVTPSGHNCEHDGCPRSYILSIHGMSSDLNWGRDERETTFLVAELWRIISTLKPGHQYALNRTGQIYWRCVDWEWDNNNQYYLPWKSSRNLPGASHHWDHSAAAGFWWGNHSDKKKISLKGEEDS